MSLLLNDLLLVDSDELANDVNLVEHVSFLDCVSCEDFSLEALALAERLEHHRVDWLPHVQKVLLSLSVHCARKHWKLVVVRFQVGLELTH